MQKHEREVGRRIARAGALPHRSSNGYTVPTALNPFMDNPEIDGRPAENDLTLCSFLR